MTSTTPRTPRTVVPIDSSPLLAVTFDHGRVTELRHSVAACVGASGLAGQRLDDFVLAVHELITNAVRHGGGRGWLRLWHRGGAVLCEVTDHGTGIGADRPDNEHRSAPEAVGGWGLLLARRLSDEMVVETGPAGTTVRIAASLPGDRPAPTDSP